MIRVKKPIPKGSRRVNRRVAAPRNLVQSQRLIKECTPTTSVYTKNYDASIYSAHKRTTNETTNVTKKGTEQSRVV